MIRRLRPVRLALAVLWTAAAAAGFLLPGRLVPDPTHPGQARVVHVVAFAGAAWLWLWAFPKTAFPRAPLVIGAVGVALAVGSELWQMRVVSGRGAQPLDLAADLAGLALGFIGAWASSRWRRELPLS